MAIATSCPNCFAQFNLNEEMAGKKVKCQRCATIFVVPAAATTPKPVPVATLPNMEIDDEPAPKSAPKEAVTTTPKKAAPPKVTVPVDDDDDADDEDRKTQKRSGPPPVGKKASEEKKTRRADRSKAGSSGSSMGPIFLVLGGIGLVTCMCCGVGGLASLLFEGQQTKVVVADKGMPNFDKDIKIDKNPPPIDPFKDQNPPIDPFKDKFNPPPIDPFQDKNPPPPIIKKKKVGGGINATLVNGEFRTDSSLTIGDLRKGDAINGKHYKTYVVSFEAGGTYQIDLMSRIGKGVPGIGDPYLFLYGPDNQLLRQDDDGGEGLNSRIVFLATQAGTYRIEVTTLNGGQGNFSFLINRLN